MRSEMKQKVDCDIETIQDLNIGQELTKFLITYSRLLMSKKR